MGKVFKNLILGAGGSDEKRAISSFSTVVTKFCTRKRGKGSKWGCKKRSTVLILPHHPFES